MTQADPGRLSIRWSHPEAQKPYARPFGVAFWDAEGGSLGSVAVSGAELLYYRQFQTAVLALAGELFCDHRAERAGDAQLAWLDRLSELLPAAGDLTAAPVSSFEAEAGRVFRFRLADQAGSLGVVAAPLLVSYQDLQAAIAHQSGRLYRHPEVERIAEAERRQTGWVEVLRGALLRPGEDEAMAASWPWR